MNIFIVGLRRSGTTVFWRMFRDDDRLLCLDEPFNPLLSELPEPLEKGTRTEFIDIYKSKPNLFRRKFSPIGPEEELEPGLTDRQTEYLTWLLAQGRHVVCDFTRCTFKVEDLYRIDPSAVLVHLHRRPECVATSHLLPSGSGTWRKPLANLARRMSFWWRRGWYDNWHFETIIGQSADGRVGDILRSMGVSAQHIYELPAAGRVMAYWAVAYEAVESSARACFSDQFLSIRYEDFCFDPEGTVSRVYDAAKLQWKRSGEGNVEVHPPKAPFMVRSSRVGETAGGAFRRGASGRRASTK